MCPRFGFGSLVKESLGTGTVHTTRVKITNLLTIYAVRASTMDNK